jgi:hypothetical protein
MMNTAAVIKSGIFPRGIISALLSILSLASQPRTATSHGQLKLAYGPLGVNNSLYQTPELLQAAHSLAQSLLVSFTILILRP